LHGFGQYQGKEECYEGEWRGGKIEGVGKFRWANGDEYEGQWRDSKAEGRGVYRPYRLLLWTSAEAFTAERA
jgi:hypothetical protein